MELYADEMKDIKNDNFLRSAFWEGGARVDAFLTAAAAQVCLVGLHCEHYVTGPEHCRIPLFNVKMTLLSGEKVCV